METSVTSNEVVGGSLTNQCCNPLPLQNSLDHEGVILGDPREGRNGHFLDPFLTL